MPYAQAAKAKGKKVYHLNIGQPDIATPPWAVQKLKETAIDVLAYSPGAGWAPLRKAVADYNQARGIAITEEEVLVTSGASEGLYFLFIACLEAGDNIIVPEPFYANYNGFAHMADIELKSITSHIEDEFALPDIDKFEALIDNRTRAILITNPNNPTGCVYSKATLEALGRLVKKHDLFLFSDEVYQDFCYTDEPFFSALSLQGVQEHVVVLDSVSKKYSACGARIGYIFTKNEQVFHSVERCSKLRLSPPALSEFLAIYMLENDQEYMASSKAAYDSRRRTVFNRLKNMPGVTCYLPKGSFYCFAKFPVQDAEHFCRWLLESFEHNGETVMLSPGQGFYATPGLGIDEVRIAFVLNENKLNHAMDCLELGLAKYTEVEANLVSQLT